MVRKGFELPVDPMAEGCRLQVVVRRIKWMFSPCIVEGGGAV